MKSGTDLVNEAKTRIPEMSAEEALAAHAAGGATFLDVRDLQEVNLGRIPGAVHISRGNLENKVEGVLSRETTLVVYCGGGSRSALAADTLRQMGYTKVCSLAGGFRGWAEAGGDIDG
ncbi:MAG TPA: rhodanese-like domain-containing protein [Gemmatimonadaceae bacterium]|nr:rhodanese-like domain-containing protein [Gemmatimonadaceae bacterium]